MGSHLEINSTQRVATKQFLEECTEVNITRILIFIF